MKVIKKDIRNIQKDIGNADCIIHLATVNDPRLVDANLTWDVNVVATFKIINLAINQKIKKFIYASSGSVYGIKNEKDCEDLSLEPISEYNKSKMICERILISFNSILI